MSLSSIRLTAPDGGELSLPAGEPLAAVAPPNAVAATLDGREVDLAHRPDADAEVRFLTPEDPAGLHVFRHSSAHLLAAAVKDLFPEARYGIGPPSRTGSITTSRSRSPSRRRISNGSSSGCGSW